MITVRLLSDGSFLVDYGEGDFDLAQTVIERLEDREKILAWLHKEANTHDNISDTPRHHALMLAAEAIARGEHLKPSPTSHPEKPPSP